MAGLTYNFLPFMILPLYIALEKIDYRSSRRRRTCTRTLGGRLPRVTFPLALPGVFAGSLLTFIPAMGDYINAELLGNPQTRMIGNVIQNRLLVQNDYPVGSALSFILMAGDPRRRGAVCPRPGHRAADRLMTTADATPVAGRPPPRRAAPLWRRDRALRCCPRSRSSRSST